MIQGPPQCDLNNNSSSNLSKMTQNEIAAQTPQELAWLEEIEQKHGAIALGRCYKYGMQDLNIIKNDKQAFYYFKKAADQGDAEAQREVAWYYENGGEDININYQEALNYYIKSATTGDIFSQKILAMYFRNGGFCNETPKHTPNLLQAQQYNEMAAKQGDREAQYQTAEYYANNHQPYQACRYYKLAAEQGYNLAQKKLQGPIFAKILKRINQEEQECKEKELQMQLAAKKLAEEQERKLAAQKEKEAVEAQKRQIKAEKESIEQATTSFNLLFVERAKKGDATAQYITAGKYHTGAPGIPKNPSEALRYLKLSVAQKHPRAIDYLKSCATWSWLKLDAEAHYLLAQCYEEERNIEKTIQHYNEAAKQGHKAAQQKIKEPNFVAIQTAFNKKQEEKQELQKKLKVIHDLEIAAQHGDPNAQRQLAFNYRYGTGGVRQNDQKALQYFKMAAAQRHKDTINYLDSAATTGSLTLDTEANHLLAQYYEEKKDNSKAIRYYAAAAARKHAPSQKKLVELYIPTILNVIDTSIKSEKERNRVTAMERREKLKKAHQKNEPRQQYPSLTFFPKQRTPLEKPIYIQKEPKPAMDQTTKQPPSILSLFVPLKR